jgi:hypothetical protein
MDFPEKNPSPFTTIINYLQKEKVSSIGYFFLFPKKIFRHLFFRDIFWKRWKKLVNWELMENLVETGRRPFGSVAAGFSIFFHLFQFSPENPSYTNLTELSQNFLLYANFGRDSQTQLLWNKFNRF